MPSSHLILCHPLLLLPSIFPGSGSFQMNLFFASGGQSIVSASTSVLPMNTQDWSPLGWTGWIFLQSKGLSRVFSKEGERVEKGRNRGKETGQTVCLLTTSKTGQGSNDTANPLFFITDEFNTEFYKLTLSKILIDHVLQRFDFSGEKTEAQRRLLPWVSHSIRASRSIFHLPKQCAFRARLSWASWIGGPVLAWGMESEKCCCGVLGESVLIPKPWLPHLTRRKNNLFQRLYSGWRKEWRWICLMDYKALCKCYSFFMLLLKFRPRKSTDACRHVSLFIEFLSRYSSRIEIRVTQLLQKFHGAQHII